MLSSIQISGYRGFEQFELSGLGRINLLVGENNGGKTSMLEAIHLLATAGDPFVLWQTLWRRGERVPSMPHLSVDRAVRRPSNEMDVSHLFRGHEAFPGVGFRLIANGGVDERWLECKVTEGRRDPSQLQLFKNGGDSTSGSRLGLEFEGVPPPPLGFIPLTREGGFYEEAIELPSWRFRMRPNEAAPAQLVTTQCLSGQELAGMWNWVALTPAETLVLKALQFVDPDIERVAVQGRSGNGSPDADGGFIVKLKGLDRPVPIGSMGDGMRRMLAMAVAITQCRGGVLLVDEIDTGLHHGVMGEMWKLMYQAAHDLDVQVFATTHSYDCIHSLAKICNGDPLMSVTIQRIERNKSRPVAYDESEIQVAAHRGIEVR